MVTITSKYYCITRLVVMVAIYGQYIEGRPIIGIYCNINRGLRNPFMYPNGLTV